MVSVSDSISRYVNVSRIPLLMKGIQGTRKATYEQVYSAGTHWKHCNVACGELDWTILFNIRREKYRTSEAITTQGLIPYPMSRMQWTISDVDVNWAQIRYAIVADFPGLHQTSVSNRHVQRTYYMYLNLQVISKGKNVRNIVNARCAIFAGMKWFDSHWSDEW